jgi:DNA replication protein DnaC
MSIEMNIRQKIDLLTTSLKLPVIKKSYQRIAEEAFNDGSSYEDFLYNLLNQENQLRVERRKQGRIRLAGFPYKKYLHDLKPEELPIDATHKLKQLKTLNFIDNNQNIILIGNPGTGKTHTAIGLGIKACLEDCRTFFVSVPSFITQMKESRSDKTLHQMQNRFEKYDLVILDELGYISFDKEGAELLFTAMSLRAGRKSTIITTNLSFERWEEIFHDPVITAAIVDRLTHRAVLVDMTGESYRMKETKELIASNKKG